MILSLLIIILLFTAGAMIIKDASGTLRPFDRATTDPMRGLLALLIVAHHFGGGDILQLRLFLRSLGMPIVSFFFLLSGYGLCMSFKKKGNDYLNGLLSKRYSKIIPIFCILTFISLLFTAVWEGGGFAVYQIVTIKDGMTPLPYSWFIFAIIYTYAAFYISAITGKTLGRTGILLICFILVWIFLIRIVCNWAYYWCTTIPAVNLGYYIAMYEDRIERLITRHTIVVYSSAIIMVVISSLINENMRGFATFWILSLAAASYLIIRALGTLRWKPLVWLGTISLEIYLIHGLPIKYLRGTVTPFSPGLNYILDLILVYTLSITFAWLIHQFSSKKSTV